MFIVLEVDLGMETIYNSIDGWYIWLNFADTDVDPHDSLQVDEAFRLLGLIATMVSKFHSFLYFERR